MRKKTLAAAAGLALTLSGCESYKAATFRAEPGSGVPGPASASLNLPVAPGAPSAHPAGAAFPPGAEAAAAAFRAALATSCAPAGQPGPTTESVVGAAALALAPFAFDLVAGAIVSQMKSSIDALAARSQAAWKATWYIEEPAGFMAWTGGAKPDDQCVVLLRRHGKGDAAETTFVHLARLVPMGSRRGAVRLEPLFHWAGKTAALTGRGEGLAMGFALSIRAVQPSQAGYAIEDIELGSYAIGDVRIGQAMGREALPAGTGLLRLPSSEATALELTFAVSETGSGFPDASAAKAEIDAVDAALRPALKSRLVGALGDG
ncbi:hypothetical protein [Albimonas pacifica]|uniref:Lipoprotein n=1 Tax=Albimonas pacifica TaxID=1114924 RepID=A0A1I3BEJ1_9RHOB|nr:hypothetical protein [Albimonas pacifica]SFH60369.1 hypothetical protein SAMN05216258_10114 [Albimonas pacifica]